MITTPKLSCGRFLGLDYGNNPRLCREMLYSEDRWMLSTHVTKLAPCFDPRTRGRSDTPQRPRQAALRSTSGAPGPGGRGVPKLSKNRKPSLIWFYSGEVLKEEFLLPLGISAYRLAKDTGLPQTRISEILREKRRITADTALRLGKYFGVSPRFWLGLQDDYDLEEERATIGDELQSIHTITV